MGEARGINSMIDEMAPLTILECNLTDLESASRLLGHLSTSDLELDGSELNAVAAMPDKAHAGILASYNRARELFKAERDAHRAELDAARGEAASGSPADIERAESLRRMLRVLATGGDRAMRRGPRDHCRRQPKRLIGQPRHAFQAARASPRAALFCRNFEPHMTQA